MTEMTMKKSCRSERRWIRVSDRNPHKGTWRSGLSLFDAFDMAHAVAENQESGEVLVLEIRRTKATPVLEVWRTWTASDEARAQMLVAENQRAWGLMGEPDLPPEAHVILRIPRQEKGESIGSQGQAGENVQCAGRVMALQDTG